MKNIKNSDESSLDDFKISKSKNLSVSEGNAAIDTPLSHTVAKNEENLKDNYEHYVQYSKSGNVFFPCGNTVKKLKNGVYRMGMSDSGLFFEPNNIRSDSWLTFRESLIQDVLNEIDNFWKNGKIFEDYGFLQRRGYMFYGPPGTGKTILLKQLMDKIVKNNGVVFLCDNSPSLVSKGLKIFSSIEPKRNIICVFEDIDAIINRYGESDLLALLDGEDSVDHVLNIATTNYPEELDRRIIGRPRRFDRVIKIGYPDSKTRKMYFEFKLKEHDKEKYNIDEWVELTGNFTFAAMTELVISVICLGNDLNVAVNRIKNLLEIKPSSNEYKVGGKVGFSN